jgi:hypothetical protein
MTGKKLGGPEPEKQTCFSFVPLLFKKFFKTRAFSLNEKRRRNMLVSPPNLPFCHFIKGPSPFQFNINKSSSCPQKGPILLEILFFKFVRKIADL